jgi:hypothetical protein
VQSDHYECAGQDYLIVQYQKPEFSTNKAVFTFRGTYCTYFDLKGEIYREAPACTIEGQNF